MDGDFSDLMQWFHSLDTELLSSLGRVLAIALVTIALNTFIRRLITTTAERYKKHKNSLEKVKRVDTLARVCRSVFSILLWITAITIALASFGFTITPILTTAGVSGIAIGFATQSLIKDYFSGFIILLEGQIRLGDIVELGGVIGEVEEMTLRYVRLRNLAGDVIFVPNGNITNVTNKSLHFSYALIDIGVAYREDVDEVTDIILATARALQTAPETKHLILEDAELFGVDKWADSSIVVRMRIKVKAGEQWKIRRAYLRRLKYAFDSAGIEIPYPHLTVYAGQLKDGTAPPFYLHKQ
ncbi:MAG: mechanosensitive ion channel family protein [Flavobacteriaceae bacterium TMED42]|nr:MAG: mechanosensitive ion channel family protein [Flavobacteriaceae bacterium TMED42]|tara:strand:- start:2010 stop:2906 length:897 start_codon:yes stop_codon:yes gene_type:complete